MSYNRTANSQQSTPPFISDSNLIIRAFSDMTFEESESRRAWLEQVAERCIVAEVGA